MQYTTEHQLLTELKKEILATNKKSIKIIAGHAPLCYSPPESTQRKAWIDTKRWGVFSEYTFDLGAQLVRYALDINKHASLLLIIDDDIELPTQDRTDKVIRITPPWTRSKRQRIYRESHLPQAYAKILEKYALSEKNIVHHERNLQEKSIFISEKILKRDATLHHLSAPNECSLAYKSVLLNQQLFNKKTDYLLSFIPGQCKGNICEGVLNIWNDIDALHIFFPHIELMGGIIATPHGFVNYGKALTSKELFTNKLLTQQKNKALI